MIGLDTSLQSHAACRICSNCECFREPHVEFIIAAQVVSSLPFLGEGYETGLQERRPESDNAPLSEELEQCRQPAHRAGEFALAAGCTFGMPRGGSRGPRITSLYVLV